MQWKRTLGGVVEITQTVNDAKQITAEETVYFHKDHLGSIHLITDQNGLVKETLAFDPWGARRNAAWQTLPSTLRGFTGHEMVDGVDVINMNGRIYDVHLGRFLQADPIVHVSAKPVTPLSRGICIFRGALNFKAPNGARVDPMCTVARVARECARTNIALY